LEVAVNTSSCVRRISCYICGSWCCTFFTSVL